MKNSPIRCTILLSFLTYLLMEIVSRHSFIEPFLYLVQRPHLFLYNVLIIALTVSVALFFRKRVFVAGLICTIWLILGIVNGIVLLFRTTPFSFGDLKVVGSVFNIITVYLKVWQIVLIAVLAVMLIAGIVLLYIFSPKWERRPARGGVSLAVGGAAFAYVTYLFFTNGILARNVYNIADAYRDYGFVVCYTESIFVRGVDKPETYSVRTVREIADMLDLDEKTKEPDSKPNVIFLQLESFFDPYHLTSTEYTQDPVPFFRSLKDSCSTGYLSVPSYGAGTANTEFEVLTGMDLEYFGPGEYPFSTILRQTTCESIAYNLKELGYTSHMIHNNSGSFYGRNLVYPNLGFDVFNSIEYMHNVEVNPLGWAKDSVLTEEISQNLRETAGRDLIFAISVQGHGKYPEDPVDDFLAVDVQNLDPERWTETEINEFTYYINQLHQMDDFLKDLTDVLNNLAEPTVLVLYGDHMPDFDFTADELDNKNLYQTEYVIWSNFAMERETRDLEAYQLSAYVLERLNIHNGILTKLHQMGDRNPYYQDDLKMLEYDMLYGDQTIYSGISPLTPTTMQMGTEEIQIKDVTYDPEQRLLTVKGEDFTPWSVIYVNDQEQKTVYNSRYELRAENIDIHNEDSVFVAQQTESKEILSSTVNYYILDLEEEEED